MQNKPKTNKPNKPIRVTSGEVDIKIHDSKIPKIRKDKIKLRNEDSLEKSDIDVSRYMSTERNTMVIFNIEPFLDSSREETKTQTLRLS